MESLEELERGLNRHIRALPSVVRREILQTFELGMAERANRIGALYADSRTRALAEVLIDLESNRAARRLVLRMLLEDALLAEDSGR